VTHFLVIFRSHHDGPADEHYVGVWAEHALGAIAKAMQEMPPLHPWVFTRAFAWPEGCSGVDEAVGLLTGTLT
jgi:hypothetical protein